MSEAVELLELAHARPGCHCRVWSEEPFLIEGKRYRVRVPVCRSGRGQWLAVLQFLQVVAQTTLLSRAMAQVFLQRHLLDPRLLDRAEAAHAHVYTLRSLARVTRGQPRRRCHWCNRRFNRLVGPARPALLYRLHGHTYHTIPVLACSLPCWQHIIKENLEYLRCLASELTILRAISKQLKALEEIAKEIRAGNTPAPVAPPSPSPSRASAQATTFCALWRP